MGDLTGADIRSFFIVGAALIALITAIWALVGKIKEALKPAHELEEWRRATDAKLDRDNRRLTSLEDGNKALCRGVLALLNHEITGNSVDKLKDAQTGLSDYLIDR